MAQKYIIRHKQSGEYLSKKFVRGYYLSRDIAHAVRLNSEEAALDEIEKQNVTKESSLEVLHVNFS